MTRPTLPIRFEAVRYDPFEEPETVTQHPISLMGKVGDPDTMYLHQALKEPDRAEFIKAMIEEVNDHVTRGHWEFVRKEDVPEGTKVLPMVWSMCRKRKILTGEVYKWKARLRFMEESKNMEYIIGKLILQW